MNIWVTLILIGSLTIYAKDINIVNNDHINTKLISFPSLQNWDVLAPFPTASREQGADPLQAYGGIFNLPRNDNETYPSDLFNGGFVGWTQVAASTPNGAVTISFNSSQVNWDLIESWAGQAGSMWQGWAVSDFSLDQDTMVLVTCVGPGTFYVDSRLINGDKYGAGYAMTPLNLAAGDHTIYVLVIGYETGQFQCSLTPVNTSNPITVLNDIVVPNVVNGSLASPYISVPVLNNLNVPLTQFKVTFGESSSGTFTVSQTSYPTIQSGQTLPINFELATSSPIDCGSSNTFNFTVTFSSPSSPSLAYTQFFSLACLAFSQPYVFTFLDFDNSVQYAAARAPVNTCPETGCPVLLTLHGAGVDAASNAWTYAYYQQNNTWLLFPTNRRPYGWDWQGPGLQNAIQTLESFTQNLFGVPEELVKVYKANPNLVIYAGHSMGGHGCWTISTHYPDRALAVLPAAGWVSMGIYYPSFLRLGNSLTDPWVQMLMSAAISDYNDDFYTPHLVGIPLMIRMGSDDDNVPPYHLRRMARLVDELTSLLNNGKGAHTVQVSEIPGQGHWFNGVVDDPTLQEFFNEHYSLTLPPLPENFTVVTLNPATSGGRGGLQILQLAIPYRAGRISVTQSSTGTWILTTENVRRFGFNVIQQTQPTKIVVDGTTFSFQSLPAAHFCNTDNDWQVCSDNGQWEQTERGPSNYGPIEQVLRAPLTIVYGTQDSLASSRLNYAIYMTNSLYYQSRYSIQILSDKEAASASNFTNVVLIGGPTTNSFAKLIQSRFPVSFSGNSFTLGPRTFSAPATGIAFLAPVSWSDQQGLCVVLEGTDSAGLLKAIQLFPLLSTITIPDYAVAGPNWGSNGGAGLQALGFWDNTWNYNPLCGYISSI